MSEDDDGIEPYGRSPPERSDQTDTPTTTSLADAVAQTATHPTTVETRSLSATLVGVPRVELEEFVYPHQLDPGSQEGPRPVALFDIENRSDQRLRWRSARTKFIGSDEYTYQPARLSLEPDQLGPGCHTRQVELEPGSKARMVTLVEQLPQGVDVARVVQTVPRAGAAQDERLVFAVE